jgi:hypothetical protein
VLERISFRRATLFALGFVLSTIWLTFMGIELPATPCFWFGVASVSFLAIIDVTWPQGRP